MLYWPELKAVMPYWPKQKSATLSLPVWITSHTLLTWMKSATLSLPVWITSHTLLTWMKSALLDWPAWNWKAVKCFVDLKLKERGGYALLTWLKKVAMLYWPDWKAVVLYRPEEKYVALRFTYLNEKWLCFTDLKKKMLRFTGMKSGYTLPTWTEIYWRSHRTRRRR